MEPTDLVKTVDDLKYPVITVSRPGYIDVQESPESLTTGYARRVRKRWYEGMTIVDRDLERYSVVEARIVGGVGPFWGYSLMYSRRVRLIFDLESRGLAALDELRELVCRAMKRDPHLWESTLHEDGVRGWKAKVRQCGDVAELHALLRPGMALGAASR